LKIAVLRKFELFNAQWNEQHCQIFFSVCPNFEAQNQKQLKNATSHFVFAQGAFK